jgi:antitoxin (DNA-binding transcriptional repressor) of toxin-antitoxin stability system
MKRLSVSEARRLLPQLLGDLWDGQGPVIITRRGKALGKLVQCTEDEHDGGKRPLPLRGLPLELSEDFDEPLEDDWEALVP